MFYNSLKEENESLKKEIKRLKDDFLKAVDLTVYLSTIKLSAISTELELRKENQTLSAQNERLRRENAELRCKHIKNIEPLQETLQEKARKADTSFGSRFTTS